MIMIKYCWTLATALLLWTMPAWGEESLPSVVAEMGGVKLSAEEFKALVSQLTPESKANLAKEGQLRGKLAQDALIKKFLAQQAREAGFDKKPKVQKEMERVAEQAMLAQYLAAQTEPPAGFPGEAEISELYERNKEMMRKPGRVHLAQIFIAVPPDADAAAKKEARSRIYQIFKEVVADHKKFAAAAKSKSNHQESAAKGGDMGWVAGDQMNPELVPVIGALHTNEISSPVRSQGGWHLFKLLESQKGEILPLSAVKPMLINTLKRQEMQKREQTFVQQLLQTTPASIHIK
ncbi:MAG: peptidylprolyl isomerase [Magnetococcales bacterium]|nr:peptidylprolyl isomerase [Magnetococcales bacterium]